MTPQSISRNRVWQNGQNKTKQTKNAKKQKK